MNMMHFDPLDTSGPDGYVNYRMSGGESGGGGGSGGSGCGFFLWLIFICLVLEIIGKFF